MSTFKTKKGTELPILNLRGKEYLEVKYRVVWFREEHPDWSIETTGISITDQSACFKAIIRDNKGLLMSMSHKFENAKGFPDFIEKAETGAIGRALALIGYGTQFCGDELDEGARIVDSPVQRKGAIFADQPAPGDGDTTEKHWTFGFGQWKQRTVEEVYNTFGPEKMAGYITWLEDSAKKKGEQLSDKAKDAISQIESFLGAVENRPIENRE